MKKLSIILACVLVAFVACTKSKEVHPKLGDGNDEIIKVSVKDVHVEFMRTDHVELQKVVFHYSPAETQQFTAVEMTKREEYFELTLTNLLSDTLYSYFYELFPISGNVSTTEQKTFHTLVMDTPDEPPTPPSGTPEGAVNGLFTINENGDKVYFSQGNLQYQASTNTWRFAEHQWDFVGTQTPYSGEPGGTVTGSDNSLISSTYDGWIDLFGWGTSGWNNGNIYYQPYDIEYIYVFETGFGYGPTDGTNYCFDLIGDYANADWGVKNAIANGGNMPNLWRTLTYSEWSCLFFGRTTATGIRYARADVNGVGGVILLPDNWDPSIHALNNTNASAAHCYDNIITVADWEVMESYGAVFLPAASWRIESMVYQHSSQGGYWSSSYYDCHGVYGMFFENDTIFTDYDHRYYGHSVRLVRLAE